MDEQAFTQVASAWRKVAYDTCLRLSGSEADADDVAQDLMIRLWQMRADLDNISHHERFVAVAARNLWIDSLRRRPSARHIDIQALKEEPSTQPLQQLEARELSQWFEQHIAQLPSTQRAVLHLRQVEQRSHAEIATLLGIGETSVSTLLARARRRLLEEFEKHNRL